MNIDKRLIELKGAEFTHDGEHERLTDWRYTAGLYTLKTTKKTRRMDVNRLIEFLKEITVNESTTGTAVSMVSKEATNIIQHSQTNFSKINDFMMQNLEKINSDEYTGKDLDRAKATNESAKVLIDMAKVQVDMIKTLKQ